MSSSTTAISPDAALKFFNTVGKLKTLKRTGWVNNEVFEPESVADHMYRMSMLSFLIIDPAVNKDRLIKVCLVHDLAESIVGDITPYDGVTKEQKRKLEQDAMKSIIDGIGNAVVADELMGLWLEYEEGESPEAHVARQLDKYEMIVQADEYEQSQGKILNRFFESTDGYFTHPEIAQWAAALIERRNTRIGSCTDPSSSNEQQPSKKPKTDHQ